MEENDMKTVIRSEQSFCRGSGFDIGELPDGYIVTDTKTGRVHYLNPVAAIIFEMCDGMQSVEAITQLLRREFSLDDAPGGQVTSCISTLLAEGLITSCPP